MKVETRQGDPRILYRRRLAYHALELLLDQYALQEVRVRLNPDDPSQCLTDDEGRVRFYLDNGMLVNAFRSGRELAWATFEDDAVVRVVVPRIRDLVRPTHRTAFRAIDVGIDSRPGRDDIDYVVDLTDYVSGESDRLLEAPPRPPAPRTRAVGGPVRVRRAFGGRG